MEAEFAVAKHLASRYLNISLHTCWLSEENSLVVFPLWNLSGQLVGLQQYRPGASKEPDNKWYGRYFTRVHNNKVAVWGLESWKLSNTLFVCEGVFDAAKVTWLGYSAVAVLSNNPSDSTKRWLSVVRKTRPVVVLADNDTAGKRLAKLGHRAVTLLDYKDIGDAPLDVVRSLCEQFN